MADSIRHIKITIAQTDVAQALNDSYEEFENLNIHSKSGNNAGGAYFGSSLVKRADPDEAGTPLFPSQNLPWSRGDLSNLYVTGTANDEFLLSYVVKENT